MIEFPSHSRSIRLWELDAEVRMRNKCELSPVFPTRAHTNLDGPCEPALQQHMALACEAGPPYVHEGAHVGRSGARRGPDPRGGSIGAGAVARGLGGRKLAEEVVGRVLELAEQLTTWRGWHEPMRPRVYAKCECDKMLVIRP